MGEGGPSLPASAAVNQERLPSARPHLSGVAVPGFRPDSLFHETRVSRTLARVDGVPSPPRQIIECGTHLSGLLGGAPVSSITDGEPGVAMDLPPDLARILPVDGDRVEVLAGEAAAWGPVMEAALDRWTHILDHSGLVMTHAGSEATLSIAWILQASNGGHEPLVRPGGESARRAAMEGRITITCRGARGNFRVESSAWAALSPRSTMQDLHAWDRTAEELIRTAVAMQEAGPPPAMEAPAVFAPAAAGVLLHEICGHLLEADLILSGSSPFASRLGDKIAPPGLTLLDDPTLPFGRVHQVIDDEAEPAHVNLLIEEGRLAGYLSDRKTAAATGGRSSGNARRESYRHRPIPRMTNLILAAGEELAEDLVRRVRHGLLVERLGRGQVDPRRGQFRLEVERGRMIEDGKEGRPVAGAYLVGTCTDLLAGIDGIGSDLTMDDGAGLCIKEDQVAPVGSASPSVSVSSVRIVPGASL